MSIICFESEAVGASENLYFDINKNKFLKKVDKNEAIWLYGSYNKDYNSLNDLFALDRVKFNLEIPEKYITLSKTLGCKNPIWEYILPNEIYKKCFFSFFKKVLKKFCESDKKYYLDTFKHVSIFDHLEKAYINEKIYKDYENCEKNSSLLKILKTFSPQQDGYANNIKYDRFSSKTGRLKVLDGPSILTLKKEYKNIIKSSYKNGKIVQFDYKEFEARIFLSVVNKNFYTEDVYELIKNKIFYDKLTRNESKILSLSILFGLSDYRIDFFAKKCNKSSESLKKEIYDFFDYNNLNEILNKNLNDGKIKNYFGREIVVDKKSNIISLYIQSSGVDASLIGFSNIVNYSKKMKFLLRPLFIQHDALIVDISESSFDNVEDIKNIGSKIEKLNGAFPIKHSIIE